MRAAASDCRDDGGGRPPAGLRRTVDKTPKSGLCFRCIRNDRERGMVGAAEGESGPFRHHGADGEMSHCSNSRDALLER